MASAILLNFINLFVAAFNVLILGRVLMSWVNPNPQSGIGAILVDITEPILAPIRAVLPRSQMLDFSPLVAFLLLQLLAELANRALGG